MSEREERTEGQEESRGGARIPVNTAAFIKAAEDRRASVLLPIRLTQETIDSEIYGERREEVLLVAVTTLPSCFSSLHSSQSTGSSSGEINRSERRDEKTFLRPLPLAICPSSSSPFFHGEELPRCRLRRPRGWDGMELRQIGQSKVSFSGLSMGTHRLLWAHSVQKLPLTIP